MRPADLPLVAARSAAAARTPSPIFRVSSIAVSSCRSTALWTRGTWNYSLPRAGLAIAPGPLLFGVALTVLMLGHGTLAIADFVPVYVTHVALAVATALLCLPVDTRPA